MQILADSIIKEHMKDGKIKFGRRLNKKQIQPTSVDLRLDKVYKRKFVGDVVDTLDPRYWDEEVDNENGEYNLEKGKYYLFSIKEDLKVTKDVDMIYMAPRSSLARSMVKVTPLTENGNYWVHTPMNYRSGEIFGSMYPKSFPLKIKTGERVVQSIFIENDGPPAEMKKLKIGGMKVPKKYGKVDINNGVKESELYDETDLSRVILTGCKDIKATSEEEVDYSDGKKAGIVMPYGGKFSTTDTGLNTGWAPLADAGYKGRLTGILEGSPFVKIAEKGDNFLEMLEINVRGRVDKLYGDKSLGSHYQSSGKKGN